MDYVAIDFEKLNDSQLSICEVGLVVFKNGKEVEPPFHSYINPFGGIVRNDWAKKHLGHITDDMLLAAPSYKVLFPKLQQMIQDKILVVHSKGADLNYIYRLEEQFDLPKLYSKWVDTNEIACYLGKGQNLPDLYSQLFDTPFTEHHKALDDAKACGRIFERLSSETDILRFIHEEEYLPSDIKHSCGDSVKRYTEYGTANVSTDDITFNHDKITSCSDFRGKTVVLSGMNAIEKKKIKDALEKLGAKCPSSLSGKTNIFITYRVVGPKKKPQAMKLQKENDLLIITNEFFWQLVQGM